MSTTTSSKPLFTRQQLIALLLPLIAEQALSVTIGLADTLMVSSVGEAAVSGVSLVDSFNVLMIQLLSALATGGAVIAGQYLGRREPDKAGHSGQQLLLFMGEVSLLITVLFYLGKGFILGVVFGQVEPDVAAHRLELLVELQSRVMDAYNESRLGETVEVLCEGFDDEMGCFVGRTYADSPDIDGHVYFTAAGDLPAGTFVPVRLTDVADGDMMGEIDDTEAGESF